MAILFYSELTYFLQPETTDEMVVEYNQDHKYFNLSVDVTFFKAPCAMLSMNLIDPKKVNVMHASTDIYKTRLSQSGKVIGAKIRDSLINVAQTREELMSAGGTEKDLELKRASSNLRCHSCLQSHANEDDCCNSCEDIRAEFRKRGLSDKPEEYVFGQCAAEAYQRAPPQEAEGCRVQADLHVKRVPAALQIGVGRHFHTEQVKGEDWKAMMMNVDYSHTIEKLTFGPEFPGLVHVLSGRKKTAHEEGTTERFNYDIHIIPTLYKEDGTDQIAGNQYSVTEHSKGMNVEKMEHETLPPGLYLKYDFTPFEVRVTNSRKSMWHFVTECCAIIGGIFAFTGMLDNVVYQVLRSVVTGKQAGGALSG